MYCPECGHDAGDAKFCPECGADLTGLRDTFKGKTTGQRSGGRGRQGGGGRRAGQQAGRGAQRAAAASPAKPAGRGFSPALIWGVFGVVAVVAIVAVVVLSDKSGSQPGGSAASGSATPVPAVVSGAYSDLVQKANDLYNQGDALFQKKSYDQGAAYFQAAATTYAAAWKQQSTDPNVGTDYATSLFYADHTSAAIRQANVVIKKSPSFQPVWLNLGVYLSNEASTAQQSGSPSPTVRTIYTQARQAFAKAVSINPGSSEGKQAAASLKELPQ